MEEKTTVPEESGGRAVRARAELVVQLLDDAVKVYDGVTRDISMSGFSAFLKHSSADGLRESIDFSQLTVNELKKTVAGKDLSAVLEMGLSIGPATVKPVRIEHSWRKNFDVFAAFRFKGLNESDKTALGKYLEEHGEAIAAPFDLESEEEKAKGKDIAETDVIRIIFPGRYFYLAHMRDLCEKLALERGFDKSDAMKIKVAFDEVLTNAFKHGCSDYGHDKIDVQISFDDSGIFVVVRDPGGRSFDYKKHGEFDKQFPDSSRTGLHLVSKFMDGWAVNIKQGKYTEVSFFKNRVKEEKK